MTTLPHYPRILTIAGSDSGGGAGIQADLKTCAALGCFGMTAITAITAQNTVGVRAIHSIPIDMLHQQIDAVVSDIGVDAVKIGMLHEPAMVHIVAQAIAQYRFKHVVLDPVMVASSGDRLIAPETISVLISELFPLVDLITPNLDEACLLLNRPQILRSEFESSALALHQLGARAVLLKGGHLAGHELCDALLYVDEQHQIQTQSYISTRLDSPNTHGTGCTLSSAIACFLALGLPLTQAVQQAHTYIYQAILHGTHVQTGQGHGPLNHGFAPLSMQVLSD